MNTYNSDWRFAQAQGLKTVPAAAAFRPGRIGGPAFTPISHEVLTWLLFWPVLTLIARQSVFFSGPARSTAVYQNGSAMTGPAGAHYYVYVQLLFLFGFVLAGHRLIWATVKKNWLIPAMLGLAFCSILWSPSRIISLQICIEVGLCTLFACYLSAKYDTERLMQFVIFMGTLAALLSIFFAVAMPSYGRFQGYAPDAWQGICNHKNSLGISMAYVLSPIFFTNSYSRGRRILYGALILFVIYESKSVGAWADTAGMILFVSSIWIIRRLRARELALVLILSAIVTVATLGLVVHFWLELTTFFGKDPSMTGRMPIYAEVWRSILKRPILGYGFGGFWYPGNFECQRIRLALNWPGIGYSESGLMELVLQIGFVGLGLVLAMIGKAIVQGIRLMRSPNYSPRVGWFLTILLLAALTNIEAGWLLTMDTLDWVLIVVACVGLNTEARGSRASA